MKCTGDAPWKITIDTAIEAPLGERKMVTLKSGRISEKDTQDVEAGSLIIYEPWNSAMRIAVVESITPGGFIKVNGKLFRPNGSERASYGYVRIWPFSEKRLENDRIRRAQAQRRIKVENANLRASNQEQIDKLYAAMCECGVIVD
jgi:hypothetical protein